MAHARVTKGGWYWQRHKQRVGEMVEASPKQIAAWEADGLVEAEGRPVPERAVAPKPEQATAPVPAEKPPARDWPHKIAPEQYINRFPTGPDADLARSLLGETEE